MESKGTMDSFPRPPASALAITLAVIGAILLRDIRTRAGRYYTGYLMILLLPLGHLLFVVAAYKFLGRLAPVGTDQVIYFGVSILPFVIYVYMSRNIVMALLYNKPLLALNRVKLFDILIASMTLESVNAIIVAVALFSILFIYSDGFSPRDFAGVVFAIAATIYLSFSIGVLNALITQLVPIWFLLFNLSAPLFWIGSGIIFFPTAIPEPYDQWLALNPLLQCVEWIRYSYYEDYPDKLLDISYLLTFSTACLSVSLIAERLARRVLLR
jgi:capsular polysaccharide transport system permease protein